MVQSALHGGADAETNMIAAGRQTHSHMKADRERETEMETYEMVSEQSLNSLYLPLLPEQSCVSQCKSKRKEWNIWMPIYFRIITFNIAATRSLNHVYGACSVGFKGYPSLLRASSSKYRHSSCQINCWG